MININQLHEFDAHKNCRQKKQLQQISNGIVVESTLPFVLEILRFH